LRSSLDLQAVCGRLSQSCLQFAVLQAELRRLFVRGDGIVSSPEVVIGLGEQQPAIGIAGIFLQAYLEAG
jgi:hypothetical protein